MLAEWCGARNGRSAASLHIHESIRPEVSDFARKEFKAAGRSLAFGLYSASGFHAARAVEDVLKEYCALFLGDQGDIPMGLMAGRLNDLVASPKNDKRKPKENTVRHLRDLTNFDRNPLIHKSVTLEEIHATTMFNSALSVITEMVTEMNEIEDEERRELASANVFADLPAAKARAKAKT